MEQVDILGEQRDNELKDEPLRTRAILATLDQRIEDARDLIGRIAGDGFAVITKLRLPLRWEHEVEGVVPFRQIEGSDHVHGIVQLSIEVVDPELIEVAEDNVPRALRNRDDPVVEGLLIVAGEIDLRTGTLRSGRRADRITMSAGVAFDPAATCQRFERFVLEISNDDPELAAYLRRASGYALTGDISEQILLMLIGRGANGKSTLLGTLLAVSGDYGDTAAFATFECSSNRSSIPNDLAALAGKRLVVASETREGARIDEGRLKSLTGVDRLRARFLNQEWFSFDPTCKLILSVNHRPVVSDDSFGFWRRVRLIPFDRAFQPDPTLAAELRDEAPGILAWMVRGCLDWQRHRLGQPARVAQATAEYSADSDVLGGFFLEACELDPGAEIGATELYEHYKRWAEAQGYSERERLSVTAFGRKVAERFERDRDNRTGRVVYRGLARRSDAI